MAKSVLLAKQQLRSPWMWDLSADEAARAAWLETFRRAFAVTLEAAEQSLVTNARTLARAIDGARTLFEERLAELTEHPETLRPFTVARLNEICRDVLDLHGLTDPFLRIKHQENMAVCDDYLRLIKAHDKLDDSSRARVLLEGLLAGNVFDFTPDMKLNRYHAGELDFFHTLDGLSRPWLVDDGQAWQDFFCSAGPLRKAAVFVDNAGADFILGCLPLVRVLAQRGATVVVAANDRACYNDMTLPECRAVLRALAEDDRVLAFLLRTQRIRLLGMGQGCPQVNFADVPDICNEVLAGTQLLVLVGGSRALELNWTVRFACPVLKVAAIKNNWLAGQLGGKVYDMVCRFET